MTTTSKAPVHVWIVGAVTTLWNAFGTFDYTMTQSRNTDYLAQLTPEQIAYIDGFPLWMEAAWAFGVWGALAGSILLLMRSRHAVTAFAVSLAGLAVSSLYRFAIAPMPAMPDGTTAMTLTIWAVAIALLAYAWRMRAAGVLR